VTRARNLLLPLLGFAICVVAFISYPSFFVQFPVTRDLPWANWLLFAVGLTLVSVGLLRAFRHPERYRGRVSSSVFGTLSLAVLGFFVFMTEIASRDLPPAANAPKVGEKAPDFTLPDSQGKPVRLADILGERNWALLIFYRGSW
jgi:hypothetical protein